MATNFHRDLPAKSTYTSKIFFAFFASFIAAQFVGNPLIIKKGGNEKGKKEKDAKA